VPIYEYACAACGHRTDILHGVHDPGPHFCPECGTEGSMRKVMTAPAVHFKGSGWAKKERRSSTAAKGSSSKDAAGSGSSGTSTPSAEGAGSGPTTTSPDGASD
jgi:putative FmdB family regulatory protein